MATPKKQKPIILLIPGAWHTPTHYTSLALHLNRAGYTVDCVESVSEPDGDAYGTDVGVAREAMLSHLDGGRDVVVLMHSFGGFVGGEAAFGLGKTKCLHEGEGENEDEGGVEGRQDGEKGEKEEKAGVVKLIYLAAFMVKEGMTFGMGFTDGGLPPGTRFDDEDKSLYHHTDPVNAFYNDLPPESKTLTTALKNLVPKPIPARDSGPTHAAWRDIPTAYIVCEKDNAVPVVMQEGMIKGVEAEGVSVQVVRMEAGHSPFLSVPGRLAGVVRGLIE